jgi:dipeptidyl aminopeptidase/acylaminoacyl peptidase
MERIAMLLAWLMVAALPAMVFAEGKRPMKVEDLFRFQRVADPQISPDGSLVVYVVTTVDLAGNKSSSCLWLAPTSGGEPRQLTNTTKKDSHPRWSPDGKSILFQSTRSGEPQLWVISLSGGEARQLTTISTGATGAQWSPDGKTIAFVSAVYPEYSSKPFKESDAANKKRIEETEKGPVKAKVFTRLFYRHWDEYVEDKRQHLFVMPASGGEPLDVTPGDRDANPTSSTFSSGDDFCFSPDGSHLLFTAPPERDEAWSTNYTILRVPVTGGKVEDLTKDNRAANGSPCFSPDGRRLLYRAQKRAGYEADKWELMVVDTDPQGAFKGKPRSVIEKVDRSANDFLWATDDSILFTADDGGSTAIFMTALDSRRPSPLTSMLPFGGQCSSLSVDRKGRLLAFAQAAMDHPNEVMVATLGENKLTAHNVSKTNAKLLAELDMPRPESMRVKVEGGEMQMWLLKPPGFDPNKKWPLVYLVHGGPQGAWEDGWSFRWCPEVWAAQGYVVALPNPRGSTGFGQKFVDEISGDWGGKCYDDLMKGLDAVEKLPFIDKDRVGSAGASFGGYMMNWFAVNTDRFKCLITHCSVWNFESMWATTDELWFDEWEHGGLPWEKPESYAKFSPHKKAANLGKFKTPMLIIHNDHDFRCPIGQGHELFTNLQRQRVPSRFINFPDESHWVLKPANSEYWHKEVFAWLKKYVPPGGK